MFRKLENAIRWANLSSFAVVPIDPLQADESVRNSLQCGSNNVCFDVKIEIMKQKCLKSHHYQEFFLKHRAWVSLNADVSTYITKISVLIYSVLKTRLGMSVTTQGGSGRQYVTGSRRNISKYRFVLLNVYRFRET